MQSWIAALYSTTEQLAMKAFPSLIVSFASASFTILSLQNSPLTVGNSIFLNWAYRSADGKGLDGETRWWARDTSQIILYRILIYSLLSLICCSYRDKLIPQQNGAFLRQIIDKIFGVILRRDCPLLADSNHDISANHFISFRRLQTLFAEEKKEMQF